MSNFDDQYRRFEGPSTYVVAEDYLNWFNFVSEKWEIIFGTHEKLGIKKKIPCGGLYQDFVEAGGKIGDLQILLKDVDVHYQIIEDQNAHNRSDDPEDLA